MKDKPMHADMYIYIHHTKINTLTVGVIVLPQLYLPAVSVSVVREGDLGDVLAGADQRVNGGPSSQLQQCGTGGIKLVTIGAIKAVPVLKELAVHLHRIIWSGVIMTSIINCRHVQPL